MKKLFVLFVFGVFAIGMAPAVFAQTAETGNATGETIIGESAGTLPDSPFYGLKRFGEGIQSFFTFDQIEKTKLKYRLAQLRLMEADAMASLNKTQLAGNALNEYEDDLNEAASDKERLSASGRNTTELADIVGNGTYRHILVLQNVYGKVPDSAKSAIMDAIEKTLEKQGQISQEHSDAGLVNITITIGNRTITRQVPAGFAERFLEKAGELKGKISEEVEIENETELKSDIAEKTGIDREKAQEQIDDAREQVNEAAQKLASLNITNSTANKLLQNAESHLNKSEQAFNDGKYGEAFGQAISAESIAKNAEKLAIAREKIEGKKTEISEMISEKRDGGIKQIINETNIRIKNTSSG